MTAKPRAAAPTGRKKIAQGQERSDDALGHESQNTSSTEGAKEGGGLSTGWRWMRADEVGVVHLGRQRSPKNRSAEFPTKYLRAANITENGIDLSDVLEMDFKPSERERYQLQPGDIVLSEASGSPSQVGKPAVWKGELPLCCFQNTVIRLRPRAADSKYLLWLFTHFYRNGIFAQVAGGVGINHLSAAKFSQLALPIAPPDEQRRIVAEIEKQFTRLEAGVAALKRVQANLKRYRAAVLKAACEGRLVPTEAELRKDEGGRMKDENNRPNSGASSSSFILHNSSFESGSALLARILTERRQNWQGRGQYKEPAVPDTANLPAIPDGWTWASGEQCFSWSSGEGLTQKDIQEGLYPVYGGNGVTGYHNSFVTEIPTLVIGRVGALCGNVYLTDSPAWITDNAIYALQTPSCVAMRFVRLAFTRAELNKRAAGSGQPFVNQRMLNETIIPLPPLAEQTRIVAEVERRLSVVEELEAVVSANLHRATRLRQSILQKAFTGELV